MIAYRSLVTQCSSPSLNCADLPFEQTIANDYSEYYRNISAGSIPYNIFDDGIKYDPNTGIISGAPHKSSIPRPCIAQCIDESGKLTGSYYFSIAIKNADGLVPSKGEVFIL